MFSLICKTGSLCTRKNDPTQRTRSRLRRGIAALLLLSTPLAARADVVTEWNAIMESTVVRGAGGPFAQTRNSAITQLAVFEAVNAIIGDYEPYLGTIQAPPDASPEAAAIEAAYRVLSTLYPDPPPAPALTLDQQRALALDALPDGPAKVAGLAVGTNAATAMLALRSNDGSTTPVTYTPGTNPGDWQETGAPAARPGWGQVDTFGIITGAQFRPAPPPRLNSGKYARDWEEVREVGSSESTSRPLDRTEVALVYQSLTFVNLYHPIARALSELHGKTLSENARIFALLAMAGADGLISSMEAKFYYNLWRPVTAIQLGHLDGNPKTWSDSTWAPRLGTPPYPSYPSNHASGSGASIAVLEEVFGKHGHSFTVSTLNVPGVVLEYNTFAEIGEDIDDARVFGGIHFRFDQVAGRKQGTKVGHYILQHELRPLKGSGKR